MSEPFAPLQNESAQDTVHRWLKLHIAGLPQHEGTLLTESQIAEATGISRTPVREALLRLEAEGFLKIVPKKGAMVPAISAAEVEAVMSARALIEDWCVRRATAVADFLHDELERLLARQEQLQRSPSEFIDCDRTFHGTLVRAAGNPILLNFYESLRDRQVRMGLVALAGSQERTKNVLAEHRAIVDGVRTGDPAQAADAMALHLASTLSVLQLVGWRQLPSPERAPISAGALSGRVPGSPA